MPCKQAWFGPKDVYEINVEERVSISHKRKLDDGYISSLEHLSKCWCGEVGSQFLAAG